MKPVIAVDWDGTCVENVWPDEGDWLPGAQKALRKLAAKYTVMIWSTRIVGVSYRDWNVHLPMAKVWSEIDYIRRMLDEAGLQDIGIFESYPDNTPGKLSAVAYIDDKAIRFEGNWPKTLRQLARIGA